MVKISLKTGLLLVVFLFYSNSYGEETISEPDFNSHKSMVDSYLRAAKECKDLTSGVYTERKYCINTCSQSARNLRGYNDGNMNVKTNQLKWKECKQRYKVAIAKFDVDNTETSVAIAESNQKIEVKYEDTEIGRKVISSPDKNNQDLIAHFKSVKEVCENLDRLKIPNENRYKKACVQFCSENLEKREKWKKHNKNDFRNIKNEWNNCVKWQDRIFTTYFDFKKKKEDAAAKKRQEEIALNTINPPERDFSEEEILSFKVTSFPNRNSTLDEANEFFQSAIKACESLPEDSPGRKDCILGCRKEAKHVKHGGGWRSCTDYYKLAFFDYEWSVRKKNKASSKGVAVRITSSPDIHNSEDVLEYFKKVVSACEALSEDKPGRNACIDLCNRYVRERVTFTFGTPDQNELQWMACKDRQDFAFGITVTAPVKRNELVWGFNSADAYWYGGRVYDVAEGKALLNHKNGERQWYPFEDIRKFVPKGRVEVYRNGKYHPAVITGQDIMFNLFVKYTDSRPIDLKKFSRMEQTARGRYLGENDDNVSVDNLRRASIGTPEKWPGYLEAIIEENNAETEKVIFATESLAEESLSNEFKDFADDYLTRWIKDELEYYKGAMREAPLYEVAWASDFLTTLLDPDKIQIFEKAKELLQKSPGALIELIDQRITSLESLAIDVIQESGSYYTDVEKIFETGFALAGEFEDAGYVEIGQNVLTATLSYIEEVLSSSFDQYKKELTEINFTDETYTALIEQIATFEELINTGFKGLEFYKEAAELTLKEGKAIVCKNYLKANDIKTSDFNKKIYVGEKKANLLDLAQKIYDRGHRITRFSKKGFASKYELAIQDTYGKESRFLLKADKVTQRLVEGDKQDITLAQWQEYITKLIRVPSGRPNAQGIRECDMLAADPFDPKKLTNGVDLEQEEINTEEYFDYAVEACMAAAEDAPTDPRQSYQLGRLLWHLGDVGAAGEYFSYAADLGYAAALFYKAETLWDRFDDNNTFVDALELYEAAGKKGYKRGTAMVKELNPDNFDFFREIPAPTEDEVNAVYSGGSKVDVGLMIAHYNIKRIKIKDCFQENSTDFSCELYNELECKIEERSGPWDNFPDLKYISAALQLPCAFNNENSTYFRTLKSMGGGWKDSTGAEPGEYVDRGILQKWNQLIGILMNEAGY